MLTLAEDAQLEGIAKTREEALALVQQQFPLQRRQKTAG